MPYSVNVDLGTQLLPGCYVKTPTGCPKGHFSAPDYTRDAGGEAYKNAANDKNTCLVTRKNDYKLWCGKSDITMKFVPPAATTTAAAGTTTAAAEYVLENAAHTLRTQETPLMQ